MIDWFSCYITGFFGFVLDGGLCGEVERDTCGAVRVDRVVNWENIHQETREELAVPLAKAKATVSRYSRSLKVHQNCEEFWYTWQVLLGVRGERIVTRPVFQSVRFCTGVKLQAPLPKTKGNHVCHIFCEDGKTREKAKRTMS